MFGDFIMNAPKSNKSGSQCSLRHTEKDLRCTSVTMEKQKTAIFAMANFAIFSFSLKIEDVYPEIAFEEIWRSTGKYSFVYNTSLLIALSEIMYITEKCSTPEL